MPLTPTLSPHAGRGSETALSVKLVIIAVGTRMPAWVSDGYRTYAKRMPPGTALELVEIKAEARTSGKTVAQMLAAEAARIRAALPKGARVIALDERGKDLSTCSLAVQLEAWMQERGALAFLIGGADGLDDSLKKSA